MKGVLLPGNRTAVVREFPDPSPGPGEVLIRMKTAGICGSDMHLYRQTPEQRGEGANILIGHEGAGVVEAVGPCVESIHVGDRVIVYMSWGCGRCKFCLSGFMCACETREKMGMTVHGADADYMVAPERQIVNMHRDLSFLQATLISCIGGTSYRALSRLGVSGRDTVALFGMGPLGLTGLLMARAVGARVIAVEVIKYRRELAKELGADVVLDPAQVDVVSEIRRLTRGKGAHATLDFSGNAAAQRNALESVRYLGRVAFVGLNLGDLTIQPVKHVMERQITLIGTLIPSMGEYEEIAEFVLDKKVPLEDMVTHRFSVDDAPEAFALHESGNAGKIVFEWKW